MSSRRIQVCCQGTRLEQRFRSIRVSIVLLGMRVLLLPSDNNTSEVQLMGNQGKPLQTFMNKKSGRDTDWSQGSGRKES